MTACEHGAIDSVKILLDYVKTQQDWLQKNHQGANAADIAKAKKALGYDPKVMFEEGIEKAVVWYSENT